LPQVFTQLKHNPGLALVAGVQPMTKLYGSAEWMSAAAAAEASQTPTVRTPKTQGSSF